MSTYFRQVEEDSRGAYSSYRKRPNVREDHSARRLKIITPAARCLLLWNDHIMYGMVPTCALPMSDMII